MHKLILFAAAAALAGCSQERAADPAVENGAMASDANMATDANMAADANMAMDANMVDSNMATTAAMSLSETTWTYTNKDGKKVQESIDNAGNYVTMSGKEHVDHGTFATKDGKACFDSKMDKEGESCWTVAATAIGETKQTVSDKGEKLMVTRVAYVAMPPVK
jgi:hypothetical protein